MTRNTDTDASTTRQTSPTAADRPPAGATSGDGATVPPDGRAPGRTMADVAHTHPDTARSLGVSVAFARGATVLADGGRPDAPSEEDEETLADVDHEPPNDSEDANSVFERGEEKPVETVDETDE